VRAVPQGRALLVDRMKLTVKAFGSKRLKLICDELRSNVAFKFNLRRYLKEQRIAPMTFLPLKEIKVGRCRLTP